MAIGDVQWEVGQPAGTELISDIDGWVIDNNKSLQRLLSKYKYGLEIEDASTTQITIGAGQVVCTNGSDYRFRENTSAATVTLTGGAADTWYDIYAVADTTATTFTGEIVADGNSPSGNKVRKIGMLRTDSGGDIIGFTQSGDTFLYKEWIEMGSNNATLSSWTSVTTTNYVPDISKRILGSLYGTGTAHYATNDSSQAASNTVAPNKVGDEDDGGVQFDFRVLTANTIYWCGAGTNAIYCRGFVITEDI